MALSESISKTFTNNSMITATLSWTATQNIPSNNSSVTASLKLKSNSTYATVPTWNGVTATITINGNSDSSSINTYVAGGATSGTKYSRTVTVPHNADGTKTFSFGFSIAFGDVSWNGSRIGTVSHSGSGTLNTIPRASSIGTISGDTMGSGITVPINRASTAFKHKVTITLGGASVTTSSNVDTTTTLTPTTESFAPQVPNATSGTATVTLVTYNGTTQIGSAVSKTFTLKVPTSVVPTISGVSTSETVTAVANLGLGADRYVQNKSGLKVNATGNTFHGATLRSLSIKYNGQTLSGSGSVFNIGNVTGNQTVTITATDSRGRTATTSNGIIVLSYSPPKIIAFKVWRDDGTNKVRASLECSINLLYKADGSTAIGGNWYIDANVNGVWGNKNTGALAKTTNYYKNTNIAITGDYDVTNSFSFRVNVHDAFGLGATASGSVSTAKTLLDFNQDIGVGIGKLHERGVLDVAGDTYLKGYTTLTAGSTNSSGNDVLLHLNRANNTTGAVWVSSGTEGNLSLLLYNKTGAWAKTHNFMHSGKVELNGDLSVGGEITSNGRPIRASEFFANGARVHADWTPPELWSGVNYMTGNQTATPSKSLANCRNGWMLAWSDYTNGVANNYDWVFTPIPKTAISAGVNGMHAIVATSNDANAPMLSKYIYVGTGTTIVGQNNNNLAGLDNIVLRKVYEW